MKAVLPVRGSLNGTNFWGNQTVQMYGKLEGFPQKDNDYA